MLYLDDLNLLFVHIPKNAGQSIRNALEQSGQPSFRPMAEDLGVCEREAERLINGGQGIVISGLGRTKLEHLPLSLVAAHLPNTWSAIMAAKTFALVRHPRDRFFSALLQHLREYRGATALRVDDPVVGEEARRVCEWLNRHEPFSDMEYIHFTRQCDYVSYQGERIVKEIFPTNRIEAVARWIRAETGLCVEVTYDHARREPKRWARSIQPVARYVGRNLLPRHIKRALYPVWMNSGAFDNAAGRYQSLVLDDETERFILHYYADDALLHAEAMRSADDIIHANVNAAHV